MADTQRIADAISMRSTLISAILGIPWSETGAAFSHRWPRGSVIEPPRSRFAQGKGTIWSRTCCSNPSRVVCSSPSRSLRLSHRGRRFKGNGFGLRGVGSLRRRSCNRPARRSFALRFRRSVFACGSKPCQLRLSWATQSRVHWIRSVATASGASLVTLPTSWPRSIILDPRLIHAAAGSTAGSSLRRAKNSFPL